MAGGDPPMAFRFQKGHEIRNPEIVKNNMTPPSPCAPKKLPRNWMTGPDFGLM